MTKDKIVKTAQLYRDGLSYAEIAKVIGVPTNKITHTIANLRKLGVDLPKRHGNNTAMMQAARELGVKIPVKNA